MIDFGAAEPLPLHRSNQNPLPKTIMRSSLLKLCQTIGRQRRGFLLWASLFIAVLPIATRAADKLDVPTALDRYVAAPDTNYTYSLVQAVPGKSWTTYVLEMTSQAWLTT